LSWSVIAEAQLALLIAAPDPRDASFVERTHVSIPDADRIDLVRQRADALWRQTVADERAVTPHKEIPLEGQRHRILAAHNVLDELQTFYRDWCCREFKLFNRQSLA